MGSVFEPPDEVVVIGYTWQRGNASGGNRELFLSASQAAARLTKLIDKGEIKDPKKIAVFRLDDGTWKPLTVHLPRSLRVEDASDDV